MKALLITLICLLPLASLADPTTEKVVNVLRWRVIQITGTDDMEAKSVVVDASGVHWSWKLTNACPDAAYIEANAATAKAYLADYDKTEKAAIKEVSPEVLKATVLVTIDELNDLRKWLRDFKAVVSNATSLADLKVKVAEMPTLYDRSWQSATNAIKEALPK